MSLRQALSERVAGCTTREMQPATTAADIGVARCMHQGMQHATLRPVAATGHATAPQLSPRVPGKADATDGATAAQLDGCTPAAEAGAGVARVASLPIQTRLLRWGWPPELAEATAARIEARQADDPRRTCAECAAFRPLQRRCARPRRALLPTPDVGRDLASVPQRCAGFEPSGPAD